MTKKLGIISTAPKPKTSIPAKQHKKYPYLLKGKTIDEARELSAEQMTGELGPLPPMKIHCGQLVEGALKNALDGGSPTQTHRDTQGLVSGPTLADSLRGPQSSGKIRIVQLDPDT